MATKKSAMVSGMNFATEFITDLFKAVVKLGGTEEQIFESLKTGSEFISKCAEMIVQKKDEIKDKILCLISGSEQIIIDAVDGSQTLAQAKKDVFNGYVDPDFKNYGTDNSGPRTDKTTVLVYEMGEDANFSRMFNSLNTDLNKLCLTQHQIKQFCRQHRQWLRTNGYATFFLFKENNEFFVAFVRLFSDDKLKVFVYRLEYDVVWYASRRPRLVVPQLQLQ